MIRTLYALIVVALWFEVLFLTSCTSLPDAEDRLSDCKVCAEGVCWFVPAWDCSKVSVPEPRRTRRWYDDYDTDGGQEL